MGYFYNMREGVTCIICEKELLAIVYVLQHFRIYIYGHKRILFTENIEISFLNVLVIKSNRVARWIVQIQKYDLDIRQIKGVQNHLADILSRNPSGMTEEQIRDLTRPDQVMVHHIQVHKDKNLKKELRALAELQDTD
jgi:hypothetical protein